MKKALHQFWTSEDGQDLTEYSILLALMALGAVSLMKVQGAAIGPIWTGGVSLLQTAVSAS